MADLAFALAVIEQLEEAIVSNRVISMAAGILMVRHQVDAATAMGELRRTSNELDVKLARVAEAVVDSANASTASDTISGPDEQVSRHPVEQTETHATPSGLPAVE